MIGTNLTSKTIKDSSLLSDCFSFHILPDSYIIFSKFNSITHTLILEVLKSFRQLPQVWRLRKNLLQQCSSRVLQPAWFQVIYLEHILDIFPPSVMARLNIKLYTNRSYEWSAGKKSSWSDYCCWAAIQLHLLEASVAFRLGSSNHNQTRLTSCLRRNLTAIFSMLPSCQKKHEDNRRPFYMAFKNIYLIVIEKKSENCKYWNSNLRRASRNHRGLSHRIIEWFGVEATVKIT